MTNTRLPAKSEILVVPFLLMFPSFSTLSPPFPRLASPHARQFFHSPLPIPFRSGNERAWGQTQGDPQNSSLALPPAPECQTRGRRTRSAFVSLPTQGFFLCR